MKSVPYSETYESFCLKEVNPLSGSPSFQWKSFRLFKASFFVEAISFSESCSIQWKPFLLLKAWRPFVLERGISLQRKLFLVSGNYFFQLKPFFSEETILFSVCHSFYCKLFLLLETTSFSRKHFAQCKTCLLVKMFPFRGGYSVTGSHPFQWKVLIEGFFVFYLGFLSRTFTGHWTAVGSGREFL